MYVIRSNRRTDSYTVKKVNRITQVVRVGRRGLQGETATNLVQSVNGKQGVVVLNASDVNADHAGSASQALSDAKIYTDTEVSTLDSSLATVAKTGSYNDLSDKPATLVTSVNGRDGTVTGLAEQAELLMIENELFQDLQDGDAATLASAKSYADTLVGRLKNSSGHVAVEYTGLSRTGFTANNVYQINFDIATPTVAPYPTTVWPYGSGTNYSPDFYNSTTKKLRENPIQGQIHRWIINAGFFNKASGNNGRLQVRLRNPVSGFITAAQVTLPSGVTNGEVTFELTTIADNASIPSTEGYILDVGTSFSDNNLLFNIHDFSRISTSTEVYLAS